MNTQNYTEQSVEKEVVQLISSVTKVHPNRLRKVRDLSNVGLDIVDVVDVILKVEKKYNLTIPDEVPVYSVDDFVNYIISQQMQQAS
ncbi:acyl carrier protein [Pontibacter oryzae]|uniref:Acyl carrier protein n=1 Tax=Pontibacter oryzae TaxID=2304593 RepID=A0A399RX25_9BACT|nr:phosphopantetheine-binding protein [Pontibacter oryzae]RIJ34342.1 acyl carrier protein [Pontibacter oryzae]